MTQIEVKTRNREELVDITNQVQRVVDQSGVKEGVCYLFVPHTTAGITLNETWDPSVRVDIAETLRRLVPRGAHYHHAEGNADAHIKVTVTGASLTLFVSNGRLVLGTWQGVYLAEFDGPRRRQVLVKVLPG